MLREPCNDKPIGPYCPWPQDTWDDTCIHPPGCADVVAQIWHEHKVRIGLERQS
jgi:hypothetical protein